jgi:hypothetical protein
LAETGNGGTLIGKTSTKQNDSSFFCSILLQDQSNSTNPPKIPKPSILDIFNQNLPVPPNFSKKMDSSG